MEQLISIKEAIVRLSCTESAVRTWLHGGRLQRITVGRLTGINAHDSDAIIRLGRSPQPKAGASL